MLSLTKWNIYYNYLRHQVLLEKIKATTEITAPREEDKERKLTYKRNMTQH